MDYIKCDTNDLTVQKASSFSQYLCFFYFFLLHIIRITILFTRFPQLLPLLWYTMEYFWTILHLSWNYTVFALFCFVLFFSSFLFVFLYIYNYSFSIKLCKFKGGPHILAVGYFGATSLLLDSIIL